MHFDLIYMQAGMKNTPQSRAQPILNFEADIDIDIWEFKKIR